MYKKDFEALMNTYGVPPEEVKSKGGRIPDNAKFGSWLRRNDPVLFNVLYSEANRPRGGCLPNEEIPRM